MGLLDISLNDNGKVQSPGYIIFTIGAVVVGILLGDYTKSIPIGIVSFVSLFSVIHLLRSILQLLFVIWTEVNQIKDKLK